MIAIRRFHSASLSAVRSAATDVCVCAIFAASAFMEFIWTTANTPRPAANTENTTTRAMIRVRTDPRDRSERRPGAARLAVFWLTGLAPSERADADGLLIDGAGRL